MPFFFLLFLIVSIIPHNVYAGAAVARQQQMQAMQQQAQEQAVAQYMQQQQEAQIQAYQQAQAQAQAEAVMQYQAAQMEAARQQVMQQVIQAQVQAQIAAYVRQAQLEAAQQEMLQHAVSEELSRRVAMQIQQGMAVQVQEQMIAESIMAASQQIRLNQVNDMRDVMAAKSMMQARNQQATQAYAGAALAQAQMAQAGQMQAASSMQAAQMQNAAAQAQMAAGVAGARQYVPVETAQVQDIVDIADVWAKLDINSKAWALMIDDQAKTMTVSEYIERYRKQGVKIQKQPIYYAKMIDDMTTQNASMLDKPLMELLEILAVMDYDFDIGKDKDSLARKILGPQAYEANRKRMGR